MGLVVGGRRVRRRQLLLRLLLHLQQEISKEMENRIKHHPLHQLPLGRNHTTPAGGSPSPGFHARLSSSPWLLLLLLLRHFCSLSSPQFCPIWVS